MSAADPPLSPSKALTPCAADASAKPDGSTSQGAKAKTRSPQDEPAFTAQILGQTGARRGLKGGPPVLKQARSAYLETEYSGPNDRRPPRGLLRKTEV
jgi:hypothetical protein